MVLRKVAFLLALAFTQHSFAQDTTQKIVPNRFNSPAQEQKPYVILISADGFRADLADKFNAKNLQRLRAGGVQADYMQPSFPSLTFPNHYTIVTGLYPAHNGLVDNGFYDENRQASYTMGNKKAVADSSWYGGTPLWVLAEQQQMVTASYFWVASESAIKGVRPTYYYNFNDATGIDERIGTVKKWLQLPENQRPHFITFYLSDVDHQEHMYGPDSKEAAAAVQFVDSSVAKLVATVDSLHLPVNFIFVSDHGMTQTDIEHPIALPSVIDTTKFYIPWGDALLHLYAKDKKDVQPTYKALQQQAKDSGSFDVYLPANMPERWHYSKKDDRYNRLGDIILVPHLPRFFSMNTRRPMPGKHGFDPALPDMHATFYAWGPAFNQGQRIAGFENVHVYPLVARILGLHYTEKIDGDPKVLAPTLKQ
ncbi:alkaline phosphatase family protein [Deminuibacter soli]|uniref:Alkaline phosphatase family protein n=1 Tax=Deminuibacter soli TaxID=2291815 RepID=A0A3E1NCV5_9BACT|nr:ectonucleotide pyrophosphatase/phosphodiesterase [Deminuibacter soli]RFM25835.1 alkaline phosphatase family protein [Deminuibacter soli]